MKTIDASKTQPTNEQAITAADCPAYRPQAALAQRPPPKPNHAGNSPVSYPHHYPHGPTIPSYPSPTCPTHADSPFSPSTQRLLHQLLDVFQAFVATFAGGARSRTAEHSPASPGK